MARFNNRDNVRAPRSAPGGAGVRTCSIALLAVLGAVAASGCRTLHDDCSDCPPGSPCYVPHPTWLGRHCYHRNIDEGLARLLARKAAEHELGRLNSRGHLSCDFERGFTQAYIDVAMGADGRPPVVPNAVYWNDGFRSPYGHARVQDWFAGYESGAEAASALRGQFNYVESASCATCGSDIADSEGAAYVR